mmetsp:Transcript_20477/g.33957  ORF Transcript_20477/g.33957 Transcript_20477/m.33957 type:complete len:479 (-) Transcript_20477:125-1561(-)|eukprot:CAMPEP_0119019892 /NCGR_PEP_ID=MMETSP1176-20130426/22922_1 /TAXON_ID=265551 /ORGANISM="Synedropsis recta cf, Strain CCMP1620" /LENGTH=478 /DNA_ID=CAMNT_0006974213 /DNA_START=108 /DNA_END=1544 /DNA_ORIENTATION=-
MKASAFCGVFVCDGQSAAFIDTTAASATATTNRMRHLTSHTLSGHNLQSNNNNNNNNHNNMMMQSQTFAQGNIVVDVEVNIYFDALEYDEDDAADTEVIDVGKSPILVRGGGSSSANDSSNTNTRGRAGLGLLPQQLSPKRLLVDGPKRVLVDGPKRVMESAMRRGLSPKRSGSSDNNNVPPSTSDDSNQKQPPPEEETGGPPPPDDRPTNDNSFLPPPPPDELPLRFLRAGKNDPIEGQRRYEQTLTWRKEYGMDTIIRAPHPHFVFIKQHYPQFFHLRGRNNEPVWYERPPKVNLRAMRDAGVDLDALLRHYAMVTDFGWQYLEPDDGQRSITVIDLDGMRMTDFAGEVVDFTRKCSAFTGDHYPERAGYVIVVNVPSWFKMIWNVVKSFIDEVTLKKISIVRGKKDVFEAMLERIPIENIPPEYGGTSMELGHSPEEQTLRGFMMHNLAVADGTADCPGVSGGCPYCIWKPTRAY